MRKWNSRYDYIFLCMRFQRLRHLKDIKIQYLFLSLNLQKVKVGAETLLPASQLTTDPRSSYLRIHTSQVCD